VGCIAWHPGSDQDQVANVQESVNTLGTSVEHLESSVKDLCSRVEALQEELQKEQTLRFASERALREEMQRAVKVCSEQAALRTDLALHSNSRGSGMSGGHEHHQHRNRNHHSDNNNGLQPRSTATSLDLARLRQDVLEAITQQEGRVETLARKAAERHVALHLESLEHVQRSESQLTTNPISLTLPQDPSSSHVGKDRKIRFGVESATTVDGESASQNLYHADQAAQILRLEESLEALRQRVESRPDPMNLFAGRIPECFHPARKETSANPGHSAV